MRIYIKTSGMTDIRLWFPTALVFNRLTASFIPAVMQQNGIQMTAVQARTFVNVIRDSKRRFKDLTLVEVETADGTGVLIRL